MTEQYLAGLIDGEGYLGLLPVYKTGLKNKAFSPVIKIGMGGIEAERIMYALKDRYGGHVEHSYRSRRSDKHRDITIYIAKSRKTVAAILDDVAPHLLVKRDQAELLKEFCALGSSHSLYGSTTQKVLDRKDELFAKMKELKLPEPLATTE